MWLSVHKLPALWEKKEKPMGYFSLNLFLFFSALKGSNWHNFKSDFIRTKSHAGGQDWFDWSLSIPKSCSFRKNFALWDLCVYSVFKLFILWRRNFWKTKGYINIQNMRKRRITFRILQSCWFTDLTGTSHWVSGAAWFKCWFCNWLSVEP